MTAKNPYFLDNTFKRTINVSGGRSSAYMLYHILDAHNGKLPEDTLCVFANTGKERLETLDFLRDIENHWDIPITWLEYDLRKSAKGGMKDPKHTYKIVNYETASRKGEPFKDLIMHAEILPNVMMRSCTKNLKVGPIEWFLRREKKWDLKTSRRVIGLRYDEERRWGPKLVDECQVEFPMVFAKATKEHIIDFWRKQNFDLNLPDSNHSNCDLCFMKGEKNLVNLIREDESRADWWVEMEDLSAEFASKRKLNKPEQARFSKSYSYRELLAKAKEPTLFPMSELDDEPMDCNCTD